MFTTNNNKGFHLTFENGWTISVQFGPGNYCDHRSRPDTDPCITAEWYDAQPSKVRIWESTTAEVEAWNKDDVWYNFGDDEVKGYMTANEVLELMNMIASKEE